MNTTSTIRIFDSSMETVKRVAGSKGGISNGEAFDIICKYFDEHNNVDGNFNSLYAKLDYKKKRIITFLKINISLDNIVHILNSEINETMTLDDFKDYLLSRKIHFFIY